MPSQTFVDGVTVIQASWLNDVNTFVFSGGGGGTMVYPPAGIPNSTGTAWGASYTTNGSGTAIVLATSPTLTTPSFSGAVSWGGYSLAAPTGSTTTFLRNDGTWAVPAGGGGGITVSGTPLAGQSTEWLNATTIQGVAVTGTGSYVKANSPTLTSPTFGTPILGTPSSGNLASCTGIPVNNAIGNLSVARLNSGTGASSSTYWRGDGTWATPPGGGGITEGAWNTITLPLGSVFAGAPAPAYRLVGTTVQLRGAWNMGGSWGSPPNDYLLTTLPAGFRPTGTVGCAAAWGGVEWGAVTCANTGALRVSLRSGASFANPIVFLDGCSFSTV